MAFVTRILAIMLIALPAHAETPQQCRCKEQFRTPDQAIMRAQQHWDNHRYELDWYKCQFCDGYHLTTRDKQ